MRIFIAFLIATFVVLFSSCRNDFEFEDYQGNLKFSKETVYLDTVFSNIGSSTYRLKVYNNSDTDLVIPTLKLGKGVSSKFRLMVDGLTGEDHNGDKIGDGKIFYNVELLARDSMFVFIEVTSSILDANPVDFLYTDEIQFYSKNNQVLQKVNLVTLVQDAVFIYPERTGSPNNFSYEIANLGLNSNGNPLNIIGSNLSNNDPINGDELLWTNQKPYVIYGYAVVPNGQTLVINKGAKVYFHANSGLLVNKTASLQINGTKSEQVVFEGDRLEYSFSETPGQWGAIVFLSEINDNNWIKYATIKNASVGLFMQPFELYQDNPPSILGSPNILIENSRFYNHSNIGILGRNATITGKNVVINNCGEASLACTFGGSYNFTHSTINNSFNSTKQTSLVLNDYRKISQTTFDTRNLQANFNNCIIYGSNSRNIFLDKKGSNFNFTFDHCLIKFNSQNLSDTQNLYVFTNNTYYKNCSITDNSTTHNPKYKNVNRNQLWPTQDLNLPFNPLFANGLDINEQPRASNTNLGAYQTIP